MSIARAREQADAAELAGDIAKARRLRRWIVELEDCAACVRKARELGVHPLDITEFGKGGKVLPFKGGTYDT